MGRADIVQRQSIDIIGALGKADTERKKAQLLARVLPIKVREGAVAERQAAQESPAGVPAQDEDFRMAPEPTQVTGSRGFGPGGSQGGADLLKEVFGGGGPQPAGAGKPLSPGKQVGQVPSGSFGTRTVSKPPSGFFLLDSLRSLAGKGTTQVAEIPTEEVINGEADTLAAAVQENRALEQSGDSTKASRSKVLKVAGSVWERYHPKIAQEISVRGFSGATKAEGARKAKEAATLFGSKVTEERQRKLRAEQRGTEAGKAKEREGALVNKVGREGKGSLTQNDRDFLNERARLSPMSRLIQGAFEGSGGREPLGEPTQENSDSAWALYQQRFGREPSNEELRAFMIGEGWSFPEPKQPEQ